MTNPTALDVLNTVYPYALAYIAGHGGSIILQKIKSRVHGLRLLVDTFDDAMTNPTITEAQAQQSWKLLKNKLDSSVL